MKRLAVQMPSLALHNSSCVCCCVQHGSTVESVAQWQSRNVLGWSADALSTALLTQTELSITVRQSWLSQTEGELWTFGGAQTRAHEITPQKVRYLGKPVPTKTDEFSENHVADFLKSCTALKTIHVVYF